MKMKAAPKMSKDTKPKPKPKPMPAPDGKKKMIAGKRKTYA